MLGGTSRPMIGIELLKGKHSGESIAVLGSSPTIDLYRGEEDVSIAVNGSVLCDSVREADYFLCGDRKSNKRSWFEPSFKIARHRVVPTFVAPYDPAVIPDSKVRRVLVEALHAAEHYKQFVHDSLQPAPGHTIFQYAPFLREPTISPSQTHLCSGGTIAGVATQLAFLMGAREIHLYGCSFGTPPGQPHYGYDNKGEAGGIRRHHLSNMNDMISQIISQGTKVYSHGWSSLQTCATADGEQVSL